MIYKKEFIFSLLFFLLWGNTYAQSFLSSSDDWVKNQPSEIEQAVLQEIQNIYRQEYFNEFIVDGLNKGQIGPEWISFDTIQDKLVRDPEQANEDLNQIRDLLNPEEVLILEIQIGFQLELYKQVITLSSILQNTFSESYFSNKAYYYNIKSYLLSQEDFHSLIVDRAKFVLLPTEYQAEIYSLLAKTAQAEGDILLTIQYLISQSEVASNLYPVTSDDVLELISSDDDLAFLESVENQFSYVDFIREEIPFLKLKVLLKNREYLPTLDLISKLLSEVDTDSSRREYLLDLQKNINIKAYVRPHRIGVLLPLSYPPLKPLIDEILEGMRLGLLNNKSSPQLPIELVFRDSQLDGESSIAAIRELVEEEGVIAIVGPIIRSTSEAAGKEAQRLQVPLISLSTTSSIVDIGSYVFRNNSNYKQEMEALVKYAFDYKNVRRFLILYPNTFEGRNKLEYFWEAVTQRGGIVSGIEAYERGDRDFIAQFESFTGKDQYTSQADKSFLEELEEKPEPIHDFDAIFLPIGSRGVSDLKNILFYSADLKMNDLVFLGDNGWNMKSVAFLLKEEKRDTIFVDNFLLRDKQPHVQNFIRLHEKYYFKPLNYIGPRPYTAFAYDTVQILKKLLEVPENQNHDGLQKALINMKPFQGVTGTTTFSENGEAQRKVKVLTAQASEITIVN